MRTSAGPIAEAAHGWVSLSHTLGKGYIGTLCCVGTMQYAITSQQTQMRARLVLLPHQPYAHVHGNDHVYMVLLPAPLACAGFYGPAAPSCSSRTATPPAACRTWSSRTGPSACTQLPSRQARGSKDVGGLWLLRYCSKCEIVLSTLLQPIRGIALVLTVALSLMGPLNVPQLCRHGTKEAGSCFEP